MARIRSRTAALALDAIAVEGALIAPAMLARIAQHQAEGQTEADYGIPKGLTLRDEIARYFRIGQALHVELNASPTPSATATIRFTEQLLRDVFGFADIHRVGLREKDGRPFVLTLEASGGRVPVVVVPPADDPDRASEQLAFDGRRRSAASALQDWLNATDAARWGLCVNGDSLRLARDNASLTRPAYVEADLRRIFESDAFADFTALWLLVHASRFGVAGTPPSACPLERWRDAGQREGVAARERLGKSVEAALLALGTGFLSHPANADLRMRVQNGALPLTTEFFGQLLRLVYRLIFLLAAEDRNLLDPPESSAAARKLYAAGYSASSLRDHAARRAAWDRHHDRWEGLLITFAALACGEPRLGLPALGGLFDRGVMPDLENAKLANRALMEAMYRLAWLKEDSGRVMVNWRDMAVEEFGSVYEGLLELTPRLVNDGRAIAFAEGGEAQGHARKTTGSYYTPDSLVQALLDSALDPVLDRVQAEADDPAAALLSVTVIDPACGSGHFLVAAARRIADRLARARADGVGSRADYRHALRDVVRACIHGVDRNPMAVELTKVALWIETVEPGRPLGFLDANIRCGDSLLGAFDLDALKKGIPDPAYRQLSGDDRDTAKHFEKRNKSERVAQGSLDFTGGRGTMPAQALAGDLRAFRAMPEDSADEIAAKREKFRKVQADPRRWSLRIAADLYVAAFLTPKTGGVPMNRDAITIPTSAHVWDALGGHSAYDPLIGRAQDLAAATRAFHWPLEFPDVMAAGGFDAVLGNPPWERIKLQEQEFFASRDPEIAEAPNAAAREELIAALKKEEAGPRERALYEEFETAKRTAEASSAFARVSAGDGGRFPLTGRGDVNTYALFAELFTELVSKRGRAGVIVPTGIATDATTAPFFAALIDGKRLVQLLDFENRERLFAAVDSRMKFSLLTTGHNVTESAFAFFLTNTQQRVEADRQFTLTSDDIKRINPNSRTVPVFRSQADAELTAKIYARVPVLIEEAKGREGNPWALAVHTRLWHMAEDSQWFRTSSDLKNAGYRWHNREWLSPTNETDAVSYVPLYEAKMINFYDHRFGSYEGRTDNRGYRILPETTREQYADPDFEPEPYYFVPNVEVESRLSPLWDSKWLIAFKDVTAATNERTAIFAFLPRVAVGHSAPLLFPQAEPRLAAALVGSLNSLVVDYCARGKVGGLHLTIGILQQLPVRPPNAFSASDLDFITPRVLELTYTSHAMARFACDLGYDGPPYPWYEDRRALLRAELDAWYARAYGLTRDELRYILDPADVNGPDYPSETFRVLKNNEKSPLRKVPHRPPRAGGVGSDGTWGNLRRLASGDCRHAHRNYEHYSARSEHHARRRLGKTGCGTH
jgi:hypothetical protein